MTTFCVTYDLVKVKNYERLIAELERRGAHKALLSVLFIDYSGETQALFDQLSKFVDGDDRLAVIRMHHRPKTLRAFTGTKEFLDARY